jgi:hypothetical protein
VPADNRARPGHLGAMRGDPPSIWYTGPDIDTTQNSQICVRSSDGGNDDLAPISADLARRIPALPSLSVT